MPLPRVGSGRRPGALGSSSRHHHRRDGSAGGNPRVSSGKRWRGPHGRGDGSSPKAKAKPKPTVADLKKSPYLSYSRSVSAIHGRGGDSSGSSGRSFPAAGGLPSSQSHSSLRVPSEAPSAALGMGRHMLRGSAAPPAGTATGGSLDLTLPRFGGGSEVDGGGRRFGGRPRGRDRSVAARLKALEAVESPKGGGGGGGGASPAPMLGMGASAGARGRTVTIASHPCNIGGRAGATVATGDVAELVVRPRSDSSSADAAAIADGVPNVASICGVTWRGHNPTMYKINQDRMGVCYDAATRSLLLLVFDGHGQNGHKVSEFMVSHMPGRLFSEPRFATAPLDALGDVLVEVEATMLREAGIDCALSGSTAVCVVLRGDSLYVASVGDSRAVLCANTRAGRVQPVPLTVDHKPDAPAERARILAAGGRVLATKNRMHPHLVGPMRVWLKDVPAPGLAMSRAIGDLVAKTAGVVSTPHRLQRTLKSHHMSLIMASDGLWDFVPNEEVVSVVSKAPDSRAAAHTLLRTARSRWLERTGCADDTTILVISLALGGSSV